MSLALCKAKWAVKADILANGQKVSQFSCAELNNKCDQYFAANMEALINQALVDVWRLPSFARYRQTQTSDHSGALAPDRFAKFWQD
jgi:hypothetical protein